MSPLTTVNGPMNGLMGRFKFNFPAITPSPYFKGPLLALTNLISLFTLLLQHFAVRLPLHNCASSPARSRWEKVTFEIFTHDCISPNCLMLSGDATYSTDS